jgi:hypothetical protein
MNYMGNTFPYWSLWVSTIAREWSEANVYNKKSFKKSRLEALNFLKDSFSIDVHLNYLSFLIICSRNLTILAKSSTNICKKLSFQKWLHWFLVVQQWDMHDRFSVFWIDRDPSFRNYMSHKLSFWKRKDALLGIQRDIILPTSLKNIFQVVWVINYFLGLHYDMIEVYHHTLTNQTLEFYVHFPLESCSCIDQDKGHPSIHECSPLSSKNGL